MTEFECEKVKTKEGKTNRDVWRYKPSENVHYKLESFKQ